MTFNALRWVHNVQFTCPYYFHLDGHCRGSFVYKRSIELIHFIRIPFSNRCNQCNQLRLFIKSIFVSNDLFIFNNVSFYNAIKIEIKTNIYNSKHASMTRIYGPMWIWPFKNKLAICFQYVNEQYNETIIAIPVRIIIASPAQHKGQLKSIYVFAPIGNYTDITCTQPQFFGATNGEIR